MAEFRTDTIFRALKAPLGVVDNAERRQQLENFVDAAKLSLEQSVFELLSEFSEAVNGQVSAHYEVSLGYRPGVLSLDVREREPDEPADQAFAFVEGEVEKITLRIPAELKELSTEAAAKAGLSVNAWFVRVLARALRSAETGEPPSRDRGRGRHRGHRGPGGRLSGWVGRDD